MTDEDEQPIEGVPAGDPAAAADAEAAAVAPAEPDLDSILDAEVPSAVKGDGLGDSEAESLCAAVRSTVIVLAGGVGSGKTTLLTSIYEQFNQQGFGAHLFAGSETLFGFEKRAHGWRVSTGVQATGLTQPPWLHLTLREQPPAEAQHLLMADLSGEHFERLVSGERTPKSFPMLSRADHVALVLDGHKLADAQERLTERSRGEQLLRLLAAQRVLPSTEALSLVVAKLDRYLEDGREDDLEAIATRLQTTAGLGDPIPLFRTAALPASTSYPMGHGVDALLAHWLRPLTYMAAAEPTHWPPGKTAYSRFGYSAAWNA